ncbi:MAG: aminotransferase class I/II-fold pyridoxal phosphate-dependent enzyme, partial [Gammaproteobacteria bacterium]|nr:aminotransferase class I/II-fold pyridoxal phosphate-dependent enzyme [Gammaproteobacteria bacterium]
MAFAKPEVEAIKQNGITKVALPRLDEPDIIPLWFGEGDRSTSEVIVAAARAALDAGDTFYVHTRGRQNLRDALKRYLDGLYSVDIHPDRITVPGSSMLAITLGAQMALGRGDHGLIISPHWPNIENTMRVTGAEVSTVRQRFEQGRWHLPVEDIAAAIRPNTRMIFVNTPCNPTGWVMRRDEQLALLELCRPRDILILADEVYHRTVYSGEAAPSFLQVASADDPVIVVSGFSKAWAMTGWR